MTTPMQLLATSTSEDNWHRDATAPFIPSTSFTYSAYKPSNAALALEITPLQKSATTPFWRYISFHA